jgi:hypothetical protein
MGSYFYSIALFLIFIVALGAAILWMRTKGLAALLQLIASSVAFLLVASEPLAQFLQGVGSEQLVFFIHRPDVVRITVILLVICMILFPIGYLWHALHPGTKRI